MWEGGGKKENRTNQEWPYVFFDTGRTIKASAMAERPGGWVPTAANESYCVFPDCYLIKEYINEWCASIPPTRHLVKTRANRGSDIFPSQDAGENGFKFPGGVLKGCTGSKNVTNVSKSDSDTICS
jgi:hypothetical protein